MASLDDTLKGWNSTNQTLDSPVSNSLDTLNKINAAVPVVGSSVEEVLAHQYSGKNLLLNTLNPSSQYKTMMLGETAPSITGSVSYGSDWTTVTTITGENYYRFNNPSTQVMLYTPGQTYTLSGWAKSSTPLLLRTRNQASSTNMTTWDTNITPPGVDIGTTPGKFSFTITVPSNAKNFYLSLQIYLPDGATSPGAGSTWSFKDLQLEVGSIATPFNQSSYDKANVYESQNSKITLDKGTPSYAWTSATDDLTKNLLALPDGLHTFYCIGTATNNLAKSDVRGLVQVDGVSAVGYMGNNAGLKWSIGWNSSNNSGVVNYTPMTIDNKNGTMTLNGGVITPFNLTPTLIADNTDVNTLQASGYYFVETKTGVKNLPSNGANWTGILVLNGDSSNGIQIAVNSNTGALATRGWGSNTTFSAWQIQETRSDSGSLWNPTMIPAGSDFDTYKTSGWFAFANVASNSLAHSPAQNGTAKLWGAMLVVSAGSMIYQYAYGVGGNPSNSCFWRMCTGSPSAWSAWNKIVTQSDIDTAATAAKTAATNAQNNSLGRNPANSQATQSIDFSGNNKITVNAKPVIPIVMCTSEADAKTKSAADPNTLYVYPE